MTNLLGVVSPWILLVTAAGLSLFAETPYWSATAAYLAAGGVVWMGVVYLLTYAANMLLRDRF